MRWLRAVVIIGGAVLLMALCSPRVHARDEPSFPDLTRIQLGPPQSSFPQIHKIHKSAAYLSNPRWRWAFASAVAFDYGSTLWLTHSRGGRELDPLIGNSLRQQLPIMGALWAATHFGTMQLERSGRSRAARRILKLGTWLHGGAGAWNIYQGVK